MVEKILLYYLHHFPDFLNLLNKEDEKKMLRLFYKGLKKHELNYNYA